MQLNILLQGIDYTVVQGIVEREVDQIIYDSRIKTEQGVFVAVKGFETDGHKYISQAIENGAKTIVLEDVIEGIPHEITIVQVANTREVMAHIASNMYENPSEELQVVGVTGTNGKTSITFLLGQILEAYKHKIGVIGTIENRIGDVTLKANRTTPESLDLQKLFRQMCENDVSHCLMEVSSHALELNRVDQTAFRVGIFTNLTQDHLDFHVTMDAYAKAKAKLFRKCEIGMINRDSDYADCMIEESTCKVLTYGIDGEADYRASDIKIYATHTTYKLLVQGEVFQVEVPIPGKFTVYNTLAVIGTMHSLGFDLQGIVDAIKEVRGVPGRVQSFSSSKGYSVLVDYAHTPDGLENVLESIEQFAEGDIITVFGCGGDRDNTKRPIMGAVAAKYSNQVIITSDNPRSENPASILDQVEVGVKESKTPYLKIEDRKEAIHKALEMAKKGDVILVAGKGHENYQILNDRIIHFDDSEIVEAYIQGECVCN